MKQALLIPACMMLFTCSFAQQKETTVSFVEQQLELQAEKAETTIEDDYLLQQLEHYAKHPLNLNEAEEDDLKELIVLNDLQIQSFLQYKRLLGKLINIYELQAVPAWNIPIIRSILPYITVRNNENVVRSIKERSRGGEHLLLAGAAAVLERSAAYRPQPGSSGGNSYYRGSPEKLNIRYTYKYKNLMQWGVLGAKDAGEPFFRGRQKNGFDFYSFHFFISKSGIIRSLALGDFTVNMGQGLMQWQSLAFKKSADITNIKRQSPVLRPYHAAGEYNFQRGAGITLQKGNWEATAFISAKRISGNADTTLQSTHISSLLASGYHRTISELQNRNNVRQLATGGNLTYHAGNWHIGANVVKYTFSVPVQKEAVPYNLFAIKGSVFTNAGIDYSFTRRNVHLFGESAIDKNRHKAFLQGLIVTPAPAIDVSVVLRLIDKNYQAINANAFTENTYPSNEKGMYAGITIRPSTAVSLNAYADVFHFPWLKYRVDAPAYGREYFLEANYNPGREIEITSRFRIEQQPVNREQPGSAVRVVNLVPKHNWRMQWSLKVHPAVTLQNRLEVIWYDPSGPAREEGYLTYLDVGYKPPLKTYGGNMRFQYFETEGYNARIYSFEQDVLYGYAVPAFYDKGFRAYLNLHGTLPSIASKGKPGKIKTTCWFRLARTVYPGKDAIGSGPDQIKGNKKTELKFQLMITM